MFRDLAPIFKTEMLWAIEANRDCLPNSKDTAGWRIGAADHLLVAGQHGRRVDSVTVRLQQVPEADVTVVIDGGKLASVTSVRNASHPRAVGPLSNTKDAS